MGPTAPPLAVGGSPVCRIAAASTCAAEVPDDEEGSANFSLSYSLHLLSLIPL